MEKDIKQHSITYNKGITNQPSYILTDDGELSDCNGLTFENGELKPIQNAKTSDVGVSSGHTLQYVHKGNRITTSGSYVYYNGNRIANLSYSGTLREITSVGNTLIVLTSSSKYYALWNGSSYKYLGTKIPEPYVRLKIQGTPGLFIETSQIFVSVDAVSRPDHDTGVCIVKDQPLWNDVVWGKFAEARRKVKESKGFSMPFAVRYAVRLYDGTYTMQSNPVVFWPSVNGNFILRSGWWGDSGAYFRAQMKFFLLYYVFNTDYSNWSDIVSGVDLFVSKEINIYDTSADAPSPVALGRNDTTSWQAGIYCEDPDYPHEWHSETATWDENHAFYRHNFPERAPKDVTKELGETSVFFKLCTLEKANSFKKLDSFSVEDLKNLETQSTLSNDYYSHCPLTAECSYAYNGRLHLGNLSRGFFGGFYHFIGIDYVIPQTKNVEVAININGSYKIISYYIDGYEAIDKYFYYPDPRARYVKIGNNTYDLKEHPGLNGAYTITHPNSNPTQSSDSFPSSSSSSLFSGSSESLPSTIAVSEADNPFVFKVEGYNTVGNGEVKGFAAVTMALSEYQHGKNPLVVFSTDGIWSLSVSSEGYYIAIQAVSREVCNNPDSITQVDMGIFFTSEKGLMYIDTSGVKCVSGQMRGTEFDNFIDSCLMAYDYRDSLLHIFRTGNNETSHYVYNMKTGTFSTMANENNYPYVTSVNAYPDTLIQNSQNQVLSLLNKPDEQDPNAGTYSGQIITRPMKFGNILTLKSIRQLRHLYAMNPNATVSLTIKASNDGVNWATLTSLRGKPWKLYRFEITMTGLKATDRYAGTVVWTQERRTEKLR